MAIIPLKELPLTNDFLFGEVMRREPICKLFLEALLQKEIRSIEFIDKQKDLSDSYLYHGIRLDVYLNDDQGTIYNIEMQATNQDDLARRARFYQSAIDRRALEKNTYYTDLADSYVVFVCSFDYFGRGLAVYERESRLKGCPGLSFEDGSHVLVLNSQFTQSNAAPAILEFLTFLRDNNLSAPFHTALMSEVTHAVDAVRSDREKEVLYMTWELKMEDIRRSGLQEGRKAGIQEGRKAGIQEGLQKGERNIILQLLSKHSIAEVAAMLGRTEEEIRQIAQ